MAKALALILICAMLAGCAVHPPIEADGVVSFWCATNTAEQPTRAQYATFTDAQKREMDVHNSYGAKHCHWKP
ncbi:MAG: hypothetical protein ABI216_21720 [Devosia sp.]